VNFQDVPTDGWLCAYWIVLCGMLIYLLLYSWPGLLSLCRDPASRLVAIVYLLASAFGVAACARAPLEAVEPRGQGGPAWALACVCVTGFALAQRLTGSPRLTRYSRCRRRSLSLFRCAAFDRPERQRSGV
jgi:hypothetical protein